MGHRESAYAAAVYGSVLAAALLGALRHEHLDAKRMTITLLVSMLVFWLAHAWSEVVGERVASGERFQRARIGAISRSEWPLVQAALLPAILLALGWARAWSTHTALNLALAAAVVQLVAWGAIAARRSQMHWAAAFAVGAVDGLLGLSIVVLEVLIH